VCVKDGDDLIEGVDEPGGSVDPAAVAAEFSGAAAATPDIDRLIVATAPG